MSLQEDAIAMADRRTYDEAIMMRILKVVVVAELVLTADEEEQSGVGCPECGTHLPAALNALHEAMKS